MRTPTRLALALIATLAIGCSATPAPKVVDGATVAKRPPEVTGETTGTSVVDLSPAGTGLYREGSAADETVPTDRAAVDDLSAAVTRWVDAHLTDLRQGGPGRVEGTGLAGDVGAAAFGLTSDAPAVDRVTYALTIAARGEPEWAQVRATVTVGEVDRVGDFIFLPHRDGPRLVAFHAETRAPVPDEAEEEAT